MECIQRTTYAAPIPANKPAIRVNTSSLTHSQLLHEHPGLERRSKWCTRAPHPWRFQRAVAGQRYALSKHTRTNFKSATIFCWPPPIAPRAARGAHPQQPPRARRSPLQQNRNGGRSCCNLAAQERHLPIILDHHTCGWVRGDAYLRLVSWLLSRDRAGVATVGTLRLPFLNLSPTTPGMRNDGIGTNNGGGEGGSTAVRGSCSSTSAGE